ncbi:RNA polymerase sigma factor [Sandaracinus amylolyticus]|uniref:RNA polymerase sigma-70 factor, ECF subfamily n=1 Tax=Sandaracinus amylolyticus TaxID=927083 RepID=A0A0F6YGE5_9BACT|nr:sigma-70 family RNA polymerase sigma factor [Sandaracinus amylolyticus]AKF04610.1 RNA polymerase sigma-70 factor, ECF subfamily [Sandaracinus amylolyticus]
MAERIPEQSEAPDPRIAAAASGDRRAAQELLSELLPRVRNLVRYLVRGDADVDDMAQQSLIAILHALHGYRGEGSLRAWADRITVRTTMAHLRRRRAEAGARERHAPDLRAVRDPDAPPDTYVQRRDVARLLDALPDEQREAVVLHHVVGLSAPELAETLGVPFETARSRLRLGMKKLREGMGVGGEAS